MNLHSRHQPKFVVKTPWFNYESPYVTVETRRRWAMWAGIAVGLALVAVGAWWAVG